MKNLVILLMALVLIGNVSAQCFTGPPWGLALTENPYTFSTDADPFIGTDCWNGWDGVDNDGGSSTSGGFLTLDTTDPDNGAGYDIVFVHDNDFSDIGVTAGVDKIDLVIEVVSISAGANAIVKIEQYPASASFPNPDNGAGAIVQDLWDPDTTITGPGRYIFTTAAVADATAVAVTPVIGVSGGQMVIDEIWIGTDNSPCGAGSTTKAFGPNPDNSSIQPSGSVTQLEWVLPLPMDCTSDLTVDLRFEQELGTDGSGNYVYDPNWGAANGTPTTMVTSSGINKTNQFILPLTIGSPYTNPLADGLYSWRVDVTDPSPGGPGTTEGTVWLFQVGGDTAPVVSQPDNQFMYVAQTDGDGDSNIRTFTVDWTYTDDGLSEITAADVVNLNWGWDPDGADNILGNEDDERGVELVSVIRNPGAALPATITSETVTAVFQTHYDAADPNYSTDIMGYWDIRLEVTDGSGTTRGTPAHHEIWATCGEAAAADPDDDFDTTYDVDLNCKTELIDLADFLSRWLNQSVLYE